MPDGLQKGRWFRSILLGISYGVLLLSLGVAAVAIVIPKLAGATPLTVLSDSMTPGLPRGSLVVVRPTMDVGVTAEELRAMTAWQIRAVNDVSGIDPGDIIVFQPHAENPTLVMHRVIGMQASTSLTHGGRATFTTQGDALDSPDDPVEDFMVRGVVWYGVPWLGFVNGAVNAGSAHGPAVVVVALFGYGVAVTHFVRGARSRKRDDGEEAPQEPARELAGVR